MKTNVSKTKKKRRRSTSREQRERLGSEEWAIKEAQRCLGARPCEACDLCALLCPDLCITRDEKTGEVHIDLEYCKGCGICASICPKGAINMVLEGEL